MAKDLKDIEFNLERAIAHAINVTADDAAAVKIERTEVEITILRSLSLALCTIAYVGGMDKESFLKAMDATWDDTRNMADAAAEQVNQYLEKYKDTLKKAAGLKDLPEEPEDPSLKN